MNWKTIVALVLMGLAIFAYVTSLDESDPDALPQAADDLESPTP
jgi:hypothetical protein